MDYNSMVDEDIIQCVKNNDDDAMDYMMKKYGVIVRRETRSLFLIGAEADDLIQEGMIGLFKAVRDYEKDKGASFATFATLCVRRQIQTAIKNSNRKKHSPLNSYVSLYTENEASGAFLFDDIYVEKGDTNPEKVYFEDERKKTILYNIDKNLSELEKKVLQLYLKGMSYQDIGIEINKSEKSVDNAIQRIRQKMKIKNDA